MNRKIKFRAWDKINKEWLFDYKVLGGFSLLGEVTLIEGLREYTLEKWKDVEIHQFTGLKDKNGNDLYEGDIVKWHKFNDDKSAIKEIKWFTDGGKWIIDQTERMVVIGNIFENPELLK